MDHPTISKTEAIHQLWNKGIIHYKLTPVQRELYDLYHNAKNKTIVYSCSRRLGKTYLLCILAIEQCLKQKNQIVKFVAPQQKQIRGIIRPLFREILKDAPAALRPKFYTQENVWRFPSTGSEIQLAGVDSGACENLRGGGANLCLVDEAGFVSDLKYVVNSILLPTTTTTKGKIILASTPPVSGAHEFVEYMHDAELRGSFAKKTIYDNPLLSLDEINHIANELGGTDSVEFKREYLAEVITDEARAVVPEFNNELEKEIVKEWKRPPYFDNYVAMDLGLKDLTAVLFAYFDFRNNKIIIEDEICLNGSKMTTEFLAAEIKRKEGELWTTPTGGLKNPLMRVSDNNLIVLNDLYQLHQLLFFPTAKDDAMAAINQMRIMIANKRIVISPKCKNLIFHLKNATWNKSRKSFERSADAGHYDFIHALVYLVRNINMSKNPYPANYDLPSGDYFMRDAADAHLTPAQKHFKNMFTLKSTIRRG